MDSGSESWYSRRLRSFFRLFCRADENAVYDVAPPHGSLFIAYQGLSSTLLSMLQFPASFDWIVTCFCHGLFVASLLQVIHRFRSHRQPQPDA